MEEGEEEKKKKKKGPYQCLYCDRLYDYKANLNRHRNV